MMEVYDVRYLKKVVGFCLIYTAAMYIACYVAAWFDVDTSDIAYYTSWTFGGELLITCILKIVDSKTPVRATARKLLRKIVKDEDSNG
jgi:hypothetical protein